MIENQQIVISLQEDLNTLKNEYAEMVYAGYKSSQNQDKLTFLFSSNSFNQLIIRLKYFEQYGKARRYQATQIVKVEEILTIEISGIGELRTEKEILLKEELRERNKFAALKKKQNELVASLALRENELKKELDLRKNAVASITTIIENIIKEESKVAALASAPELKVISENFAGRKQQLPWPVGEGFISSGYGKHTHPVYKRVVIDNKGVYIQTKTAEEIKAVFDGKVSVVASIPGMNKAVIVQHGEYRTVYANLKKVYVERNQEVKINDLIGEVYTDNEGLSELYFEVWKKNSTLNPQLWLSKK
jgi:septal ring factor EnvC (AmiA/AmiB activator)